MTKTKPVVLYLKTTETCNLNCQHCFTNGINGAKGFWDHIAVADWVTRFAAHFPDPDSIHLEFHGGEAFLAPVSTMQYVYDNCKDLWPAATWGCTSNLTFNLDDEKIAFIKGPLNNSIATSWDPDIRFANPRQYDLWRKNVNTLVSMGVKVKLLISLSVGTIAIEPIELIEWVRELGIQDMEITRLVAVGSAAKNTHIFPSNVSMDEWFLRMHHQMREHNVRDWMNIGYMESIYNKFEKSMTKEATFCRNCEENYFTLNATGTVAGCPTTAPYEYYGDIDMGIADMLKSPGRLESMACESSRDPRCFECDVYQWCGGDCHQVAWEGDVCGTPKSLLQELATDHKYLTSQKRKVFAIKELPCR